MKTARIIVIALLTASAAQVETYRLIHAIGNSEEETPGLSKQECEKRKQELKVITAALGTGGTVSCIPESLLKS